MKTTIKARAEEVWETIRDFGRVGEYVAGITAVATEGSGVGAIRTITMRNGNQVVERLERLDERAKTLSYSILKTPLAITGYLATMRLRDLDGGQCELVWESVFQVEAGQEARVRKVIERLYSFGFEGLKSLHEGRF